MLGRGSYCFTGCCKGEGLKSRRAASAGCWAGSCRCPQLFKTIPPLFRCASPGGCCGRQGAKQHELWSGSVVPSGFCSRWTLQEPCSDRGLDRLGGAGAWAWRQSSVSWVLRLLAGSQRRPWGARVTPACSVPVEKVHFQVFRAVVFYGTEFLWGEEKKKLR